MNSTASKSATHAEKAQGESIQAFRQYDETQVIAEIPTVLEHPDAEQQPLAQSLEGSFKPKRMSRLTKACGLALLAFAASQALIGLWQAWQQSPWLCGFYSGVLIIVLCWAGAITAVEWRKLRQLRRTAAARVQAERLLVSVQSGEGLAFIRQLTTNMPAAAHGDIAALEQALSSSQNDAEQLRLFELMVLQQRDTAAQRVVQTFAVESAALLALSPFALLDMALVLWRNQAMINRIAQCYGLQLGYYSRIKLWRGIFANIIYAGTTELAMDLGNQLLSVELTGKLSARLGQGVGAGLLTARLGFQAMALCRPIAFDAHSRPRLTALHKMILKEVQQLIKPKAAEDKAEKE